MDEYIEISIDVFDQQDQRAKVKKNLTVDVFIDEILREFDDLDRKNPLAYGLFLKGNPKPLDRSKSLNELDIHAQDELVFRYARSSPRIPLNPRHKVFLAEENTHKVFEIQWVPAVIGRADLGDPALNELLAVNLDPFKEGRRISRRHAQITNEDGQYYVESLATNNPTYLNDESTPITEKRRLQPNARIRLGKDLFVLTFILRESQDAGGNP